MNGFTASKDDLDALGTSVDYIASDVRSVGSAWGATTGDSESVFATTECAAAFATLRQSLATLLTGRAESLTETAGSLRDGGSAYQGIEDRAMELLDRLVPDGFSLGGR